MNAGLPSQIDQALSSRRLGLGFPSDLERLFRRHIAPQRSKAARVSGAFGLGNYVAFLLVDWLVVPDVFTLALVLRLGVITPLGIAIILVLRRHGRRLGTRFGPALADWTAALSGLAAGLTLLALQLSSRSSEAYFYHVGLMVVLLYTTLVQPTRFWSAAAIAMGIGAMNVVAWCFGPKIPDAVQWPLALLLMFANLVSLLANYLAEKNHRHRYLLGLKEEVILTALQEAQEELQRLSRSDALTQVANRRHFDEYLGQAWSRASLDGSLMSMLMIDVDHFKSYNDHYGHQAGDACLRAIARTFMDCTRRPDDLVARLGGEEFGVLLQHSSPQAARLTAERICEAVASLRLPHAQSATAAWVTVSVGVMTLQAQAALATPEALIAGADQALYLAKEQGRNRLMVAGQPSASSAPAIA